MQISKKEYQLLKNLYRKSRILPESRERESLLNKKLIAAEVSGMENGIIQFSDQYEITDSGIVAFEEYRFTHSTVKWTSIRSWIAILISVAAITLTAINIYLSHFTP